MKIAVVLAFVGLSQGADFFTGMDRHIGCFYDTPNDRYSHNLPSPRPALKTSFPKPMPQGLGSSGPTD